MAIVRHVIDEGRQAPRDSRELMSKLIELLELDPNQEYTAINVDCNVDRFTEVTTQMIAKNPTRNTVPEIHG